MSSKRREAVLVEILGWLPFPVTGQSPNSGESAAKSAQSTSREAVNQQRPKSISWYNLYFMKDLPYLKGVGRCLRGIAPIRL